MAPVIARQALYCTLSNLLLKDSLLGSYTISPYSRWDLTKDLYILSSLRQFKRFTPYKVRQSLAETLVISKIRYCLVVYSQLPKYQIQRLQKIQYRIASYALSRYVKEDDLIKMLSWLPITELVDFCIANCCFSALHNPNWPKYLPLKLQVSKRTTRKDNEMMVERGEKTPLVIKFLLLSMIYQKLLE